MLKKVQGLKTHLIVAAFLLSVAIEKGLGLDIPGFEPGPDWVKEVYMALGVSGIRDALAKLAPKLFGKITG